MRTQRIGILAAAAHAATWQVNAANVQAYWSYGVGNRVWGYTEPEQGWQGLWVRQRICKDKSSDVCSCSCLD